MDVVRVLCAQSEFTLGSSSDNRAPLGPSQIRYQEEKSCSPNAVFAIFLSFLHRVLSKSINQSSL